MQPTVLASTEVVILAWLFQLGGADPRKTKRFVLTEVKYEGEKQRRGKKNFFFFVLGTKSRTENDEEVAK